MKKRFVTPVLTIVISLGVFLSSTVFAFPRFDEGMFTPDKIKDLNLAKRGLKIKPNDIYNPAVGGISEAVIRLDSGCTGEFVSPQGLILTNHHCGYDALVSASTKERNYADIGFKAHSMKEEIPAKDYSISIPIRVEDVTSRVMAGTEGLTGEALAAAIITNTTKIEVEESTKAAKGNTVQVSSVNDGYFYYLYENKQIRDIRMVYAPPASIGNFGGDPDNFEWTRHTGDFSFLRAYVAPDGSSAQYSPNNVPFKPRKFLTVSLNGVNENDFVFVLGNPGGTTRYRESQSISYAEEVNFPFLYQYLTAWIGGLEKVGEQNEDKRISLQSFVAQLRNGQKLYGGSSTALRRGDAVAKRKADEIKFQTWAVGTPTHRAEYGGLLSEISAIWKKTNSSPARDRLLRTVPSNGNSPVYTSFINAVTSANSGADLTEKGKAQIEAAYNNREPIVERGMLRFLFSQMEQLPENQRFAEADNILAAPGSADKLMAQLLDSGDFDTPEKIFAIYSMKPSEILAKWGDLAKLAIAQGNERINIQVRNMEFAEAITPLRLRYLRGMSEMQKITPYPDANFTQRFT
ncbi:MAG: S46 family peptidase, partial [Pyrinomonadaceae bacterium]